MGMGIGTFALILPIFCLIFEAVGIILVSLYYNSSCIQAAEIRDNAHVYFLFVYAVAASDLFYGTFVFCKIEAAVRDFGIIYHAGTFLLSLAGGITLIAGLTFCGNAAQTFFLGAGIVAVVAAILHILAAVFIRYALPPEAKFARKLS